MFWHLSRQENNWSSFSQELFNSNIQNNLALVSPEQKSSHKIETINKYSFKETEKALLSKNIQFALVTEMKLRITGMFATSLLKMFKKLLMMLLLNLWVRGVYMYGKFMIEGLSTTTYMYTWCNILEKNIYVYF